MEGNAIYIVYATLLVSGCLLLVWAIAKTPPGYSKSSTVIMLILIPINFYIFYQLATCNGSGCGALIILAPFLLVSVPIIFCCEIILLISLLDSKKYFICKSCGQGSYLNTVVTEKIDCAECIKKTT